MLMIMYEQMEYKLAITWHLEDLLVIKSDPLEAQHMKVQLLGCSLITKSEHTDAKLV